MMCPPLTLSRMSHQKQLTDPHTNMLATSRIIEAASVTECRCISNISMSERRAQKTHFEMPPRFALHSRPAVLCECLNTSFLGHCCHRGSFFPTIPKLSANAESVAQFERDLQRYLSSHLHHHCSILPNSSCCNSCGNQLDLRVAHGTLDTEVA